MGSTNQKAKQEAVSYLSHDPITGEVHDDRFNIDFMRYFKLQNFIMALVGSIIGFIVWIVNQDFFGYTLVIDIKFIYLVFIVGSIFWFIFTLLIVHAAGNKKHESARIAGRRGLFTFTVIMMVAILALIIAQKITWSTQFYYFLKYLMTAMIIEAIFTLPLDYGISFIQGILKKKRYDSV